MIVHYNPINQDKLRMAYNNDVLRFYSDLTTEPLFCTVAFSGVTVTLYPAPDGTFFFNFRPYVSALINTRNFEDDLVTDIDGTDADTFIYDYTPGTLLEADVTITIGYGDNLSDFASYPLAWLAGVMQLNDYSTINKTDFFVMSPFAKGTTNHFYIKYFEGYPFDMSLYFPYPEMHVENETNLITQEFAVPGKVSRLIFSDGRIDETINDVLPLLDGYNKLRIKTSPINTAGDKYITLDKVPATCGVYFKWLNKFGGYSYWLFEDTYSLDRSTKQIGELDRDNANLENTFGRTIQIGKESQETIRCVAELLTDDERRIVEGIFDSPKIYMFTGERFSRAGVHDWVDVSLKTSSARLKNPKQPLTNFVLDFELPMRYTQTL